MKRQRLGIPTTIFIGTGFDSDNVPIVEEERADIRRRIMAKVVGEYGSVTIVDTDGAWNDDGGEMVEERTLQVIIYSYRLDDHHRPKLERLLRFILAVSRQTSVLVDDRADTQAYLIFADAFGAEGVERA